MKSIVGLIAMIMCMTLVCSVNAQDRIEAPKFAVKWSPSHLAYFYPSIQVAVEHKVINNLTLQYDLGVVLDPPLVSYDDYARRRGFRGIAELRYYLPSPPKVPFYIAAEYYYSKIRFDRTNVIGYNCNEGDCIYYEQVTYKVSHHNKGIGLKYGILLFPGWNRNRSFFFDCNLGIAYRALSYDPTNGPQGENITFFKSDDFVIFRPSEKNHKEFRPIVGVRIGYAFNN